MADTGEVVIRYAGNITGSISGLPDWPERWSHVPPAARFRCSGCGTNIPGLRSCPKCAPGGWTKADLEKWGIS